MRHLTPADFTPMPWRNGGGITHEIANAEDADGLLWRVSTARVEANCAYSRFPGLNRLSAVVEGNGVRLIDESGSAQVITPDRIATLDGEREYKGELLDGGIRHLNLVFDPKRITASMTLETKFIQLGAPYTHALYCVSGWIDVSETISLPPGEVCFTSAPGDVVLSDNASAVHIRLAEAT